MTRKQQKQRKLERNAKRIQKRIAEVQVASARERMLPPTQERNWFARIDFWLGKDGQQTL